MNNKKIAHSRFLPLALTAAVALATAQQAAAEIVLYDKDDTTFATDGYLNTFYVNSDVDREGETFDRSQSRVKMGFLPNWLGFTFGKEIDGLTLSGRSSFWVTINDSETNGTDTAIDVRQFYGTVASPEWGEVLVGKDFGLFSRSNIFLDEILAGFGNVSDTLGLVVSVQPAHLLLEHPGLHPVLFPAGDSYGNDAHAAPGLGSARPGLAGQRADSGRLLPAA